MKIFNKILIANRGEIAVRIIKTAKNMGIKTVAIYTDLECNALHVQHADEAYCMGSGEFSDTYLNINRILEIAVKANCQAIHPGYGFLAENPLFVEACKLAKITFIGPSADAIRIMGNKITAREFAQKIGVPITKGITGDIETLLNASIEIPFPILIKAAAGGGGKGMRIVKHANELANALESTSREAKNYFGDNSIYIEQYIENPRHIEIQILGDNQGNMVHLFERECTIQRRYQKIIEESPSPTLNDLVRQQMCKTALEIGKQIGYTNTGTIEFLVDDALNFYFLEMNTRIQVEHPVTEMVTGVDVVKEQLLIAAGNSLSFKQTDIKQNGHAIECRIYAENPENNFMPSPGFISLYEKPIGNNIRIDSSIEKACAIQASFDPLISKLIVWDNDRGIAIKKCINALDSYIIQGIDTNILFLSQLLKNTAFQTNHISTHFCEDNLAELLAAAKKTKENIAIEIPLAAALVYSFMNSSPKPSVWNTIGYWRDTMPFAIKIDGTSFELTIDSISPKKIIFTKNSKLFFLDILTINTNVIAFILNGMHFTVFVSTAKNGTMHLNYGGINFSAVRCDVLVTEDTFSGKTSSLKLESNHIFSPMPGKVIKIEVAEGDLVTKGDNLITVEAMKMENQIKAHKSGKVQKLNVKLSDKVMTNNTLIEII